MISFFLRLTISFVFVAAGYVARKITSRFDDEEEQEELKSKKSNSFANDSFQEGWIDGRQETKQRTFSNETRP